MDENEIIGRIITLEKYRFQPAVLIADVVKEVLAMQATEKPVGSDHAFTCRSCETCRHNGMGLSESGGILWLNE